jgi:hypothetical protein
MIEDIFQVTTALVALIEAQELEKAKQLAQRANQSARTYDFKSRQLAVHEVTRCLKEAQGQREKLLQAVEALPGTQKLFARAQVEAICRDLFDGEIAWLRTRKRQLSQPRMDRNYEF